MSGRVAPTARRRPISRVRSFTDASITARMPMPPTTREMAATPTISFVNSSVVSRFISSISNWLTMEKSSSSCGRSRCASRNTARMLSTACGMESRDPARA